MLTRWKDVFFSRPEVYLNVINSRYIARCNLRVSIIMDGTLEIAIIICNMVKFMRAYGVYIIAFSCSIAIVAAISAKSTSGDKKMHDNNATKFKASFDEHWNCLAQNYTDQSSMMAKYTRVRNDLTVNYPYITGDFTLGNYPRSVNYIVVSYYKELKEWYLIMQIKTTSGHTHRRAILWETSTNS